MTRPSQKKDRRVAQRLEYETVETADSPFGEFLLRRYRYEDEIGYEIRLHGRFLMATHGAHSERALARLAYDKLTPPRAAVTAVVGGLGAGHTLDAVLALPGLEKVTVLEVSEAVVRWSRTYFAEIVGGALDDSRVEIVVDDLFEYLSRDDARFDLILSDVDNGPSNLIAAENSRLYDVQGLELCRSRLTPGGVLGIWSAHPDPRLERDFLSVFPDGEERSTLDLAARGDEPPDYLYLGIRA